MKKSRSTPSSGSRATVGRRWRRGAWAVILLALLVRVMPVATHRLEPDRLTTVDSAAYLELAHNLLEDGELHRGSNPETFRTPGYPVLLAALEPLPGPLPPWLVGIQVLLELAVVGAALYLGRRWCSPAAGLAAGLLVAVDPVHLVATHLVMADVAAAAAVAGAFVAAERGGARRASIGGLLLSGATALRPVVMLLFLPLAIRLALRGAGRRAVAAAVAATLLFPVGWTVRNGLVAERWSLSTALELNLGLVVAPKIAARGEGVPVEEARRRVVERGGVVDPEGSVRRNWGAAARAAASHPAAALTELVLSAAEMLLAGERRHALQILAIEDASARRESIGESARGRSVRRALAGRSPPELALVGAQLLFNTAVLLLAAVGIGTLLRRDRWPVVLVAVLCLLLVLGPSLAVATARMRVPVSLFLSILAGAGMASIRRTRGLVFTRADENHPAPGGSPASGATDRRSGPSTASVSPDRASPSPTRARATSPTSPRPRSPSPRGRAGSAT